ncbi:carbohydrate sulfotransferase 4-like isoform X3 [Convolutriloba macropyga]
MRSGSTLLGELFRQNADILYVFEPFRVFNSYLSDTAQDQTKEKLKWLQRLKSCDFSDILEMNNSSSSFGVRKWPLALEQSSLPIVDSELRDTVNLTKLNTKCKKVTPAIVVKTIRLRMRELTELLLRMSDVKVVHLLRDPRAIQLSRKEMPDHFTSMGTLGPHKICNPMYEDLVASQRLVELFGANRIMQLTYDELVNHQDSVIRKLKNFANIYIDPILAKRFHRVTHGKAKVTGGFETGHPRNAELNIDRWKTELSPAEIEQFTEYNNCKPIFDLIQARVANIKGPRYSNGRVNRSRHRDLFVKVD